MGITETFAHLRKLPVAQQLEFATAAIGEVDEGVQLAGLQLLSGPGGLGRIELVVDDFATLLPATRAEVAKRAEEFLRVARDRVIAGRDPLRVGAYQLIAELGSASTIDLLVLGLADPSEPIRRAVVPALERHLRALAVPASNGAVQPAVREALRAVLQHFAAHRRTVFVEILVDLGSAALAIVNGVVLAPPESELASAFAKLLHAAPGAPVVDLLLGMAQNPSPAGQALANQVLRDRRDEAFGLAVAEHMAALPGTSPLCQCASEVPWPAAVLPVVPRLALPVAMRLLELVATSKREPLGRQAHIEPFASHPHPDIACRAMQALAALRCPGGLAAVERVLASGPDRARKIAVEIVLQLDPPNKPALLTPLLGSSSRELRHLAMQEISTVSFGKFLNRFDEMAPQCRQVAARALAKIDSKMLDRLADEIASLDAGRRVKALQIIAFLNAEQELRQPLLELLADQDTHVRATAIRIVQLTGSVGGMKVLLGALVDDDRRVRANAIEAFDKLDDPAHVQLLMPFLNDPDNRVRANAVKALWSMGCTEAGLALVEMLGSRDTAMRLSAVWAIGEMRFPGARELLEKRAAAESDERVLAKLHEALLVVEAAPGVKA